MAKYSDSVPRPQILSYFKNFFFITQTGSLIVGKHLTLSCYVRTSLSALSNSLNAYWEASPLLGTTHTQVMGETLVVEQRFTQVRASMSFSYICHGSVHSREQNKTVRYLNSVHLSLQGMNVLLTSSVLSKYYDYSVY